MKITLLALPGGSRETDHRGRKSLEFRRQDKNSIIYCGKKTWLEGPAVEQFKRVMEFPGIIQGADNIERGHTLGVRFENPTHVLRPNIHR